MPHQADMLTISRLVPLCSALSPFVSRARCVCPRIPAAEKRRNIATNERSVGRAGHSPLLVRRNVALFERLSCDERLYLLLNATPVAPNVAPDLSRLLKNTSLLAQYAAWLAVAVLYRRSLFAFPHAPLRIIRGVRRTADGQGIFCSLRQWH